MTLRARSIQQKFLINMGSKTINFRVTKFFVSKILPLQYMLNMTPVQLSIHFSIFSYRNTYTMKNIGIFLISWFWILRK